MCNSKKCFDLTKKSNPNIDEFDSPRSLTSIVTGEFMSTNVITVEPSATIIEASHIMLSNDVSRVLVVKDHKPLGILTERDLVDFLAEDTSGFTLDAVRVQEVMSQPVITISYDSPVVNAAKIMVDKAISSLVVVSGSGRLRGILTKTDICRFYADNVFGVHKVGHYMSEKLITVKPTHSVYYALSVMHEAKVSRVLVFEDWRLVGILTLSDLITLGPLLESQRKSKDGEYVAVKGFLVPAFDAHLLTVGDVMTPRPFTVREDNDLAEAADLIAKLRIGGLPVTNQRDEPVGITTRTDVTSAVSKL